MTMSEKIQEEYWLDADTYVIVFKEEIDNDGDKYHLEVEYHNDEGIFTYTNVYEYENVDAKESLDCGFMEEIENYISEKVLKRYEIYDYNDEVIRKTNDIYEALACAEVMEAKFVLDVETNEIVFGSVE